MGAVYCAVQKSLDRVVAIKILPTEFSQDQSFCNAFEAEAKAMAKLNHPNLIGVFDFGEISGMLYIIMEYVEGESLHDIIQGGIIKSAEALRLMSGICAGVASAHEHGILHRDIKPANILLDAHLQPKIGDFGLARPMDLKVEDGEQIYGTPGYTAPEVIAPPHDFDQRADIFSLGVMLHELITGKLPEDDPRPASAQVRCHPRIDAVIRKATQQDPAKRFQTAAEMAEELAKVGQAGINKMTQAVRLPGSALNPTSAVSTITSRAIPLSKNTTAVQLRKNTAATPLSKNTGSVPAITPAGAGSVPTPTPTPATNRQAPATGGRAQAAQPQSGAFSPRPSMVSSSNSSGNGGVLIVIGIVVVAVVFIIIAMGGGGDDKEQDNGTSQELEDLIRSQVGEE